MQLWTKILQSYRTTETSRVWERGSNGFQGTSVEATSKQRTQSRGNGLNERVSKGMDIKTGLGHLILPRVHPSMLRAHQDIFRPKV